MFNRLVSVNEEIRDLLNGQDISRNTNRNPNSQSGGVTNNVSINISMDSNGKVNNDKTTANTQGQDNKGNTLDRDKAVALSQSIRTKVLEVLNEQSRNGGLLSEKFQSKR